jgi:hypothetical protein
LLGGVADIGQRVDVGTRAAKPRDLINLSHAMHRTDSGDAAT